MWRQLLDRTLQAGALVHPRAKAEWWVAATCVGAIRRIGTGFRQTTGTQSGVSSIRGLPPGFGKGKSGTLHCTLTSTYMAMVNHKFFFGGGAN